MKIRTKVRKIIQIKKKKKDDTKEKQ